MVTRLLLCCLIASLAGAVASQQPHYPNARYFTIQHPSLVTDGKGALLAVRNGRRLFEFKAGLADELLPLMKASNEIGVSAVERGHDTVYVVLSVTIDHKTYLVR